MSLLRAVGVSSILISIYEMRALQKLPRDLQEVLAQLWCRSLVT